MIKDELKEYYASLGLASTQYWIGNEHPALDDTAIGLLGGSQNARVLEVGFQAGGFSVPVILALHHVPGFWLLGIDNLSYANSVDPAMIREFLNARGVDPRKYRFAVGNATRILLALRGEFDLILLDHKKSMYRRDLWVILVNELLSQEGVLLVHDVMGKGAQAWRTCQPLCQRWGYRWRVDEGIPGGMALIERERTDRTNGLRRGLQRMGLKCLSVLLRAPAVREINLDIKERAGWNFRERRSSIP